MYVIVAIVATVPVSEVYVDASGSGVENIHEAVWFMHEPQAWAFIARMRETLTFPEVIGYDVRRVPANV